MVALTFVQTLPGPGREVIMMQKYLKGSDSVYCNLKTQLSPTNTLSQVRVLTVLIPGSVPVGLALSQAEVSCWGEGF